MPTHEEPFIDPLPPTDVPPVLEQDALPQPVPEAAGLTPMQRLGLRAGAILLGAGAVLAPTAAHAATPEHAVAEQSVEHDGAYTPGEAMTKGQVNHIANAVKWERLKGHELNVKALVKTEQGTTVVATADTAKLPLPLKLIKKHIHIAEKIMDVQSNFNANMNVGHGMQKVNFDLYPSPADTKIVIYTDDDLSTYTNNAYRGIAGLTANATSKPLTVSLVENQGNETLDYDANMNATSNVDLTEAVNRSVNAFTSQKQLLKFVHQGDRNLTMPDQLAQINKACQENLANSIANAAGFKDAGDSHAEYVQEDRHITYSSGAEELRDIQFNKQIYKLVA